MSKLYRSLLCGGTVCATVMETSDLVETARQRHGLNREGASALGEGMALCAYFASWLKEEESFLNLSIAAKDGSNISVTSDGGLRLSGRYEKEENSREKPSGLFTLSRFEGGIPQTGSVEFCGALEEAFCRYFADSEQRLSAAVFGERFQGDVCAASGGVFLEALPGAKEEDFFHCKRNLPRAEELCSGLSCPERLFSDFFREPVQGEREIRFFCRCTRKKASLAVRSLGERDARSLLRERGEIVVKCPDCGREYHFSGEDITELFENHGREDNRIGSQ